jgi:hypothetical protein
MHNFIHRLLAASKLALALLCCRCSVGAPIVGELPIAPPGGGVALTCSKPPICAPFPDLLSPMHAAAPIDLLDCGTPDDECKATPPAPSDRDDEYPAPDFCASTHVEVLPEVATCTALELRAAPGVTELTLSGAEWSNVNLAIAAQSPLRVSLLAPRLSSVFIQLRGAVALHLAEASDVNDLRVAGLASPAGRPQLAMEHVGGKLLSVGENAHHFQGVVSVDSSVLEDLDVRAEKLVLGSVDLGKAALNIQSLSLVDAHVVDSTIDAEDSSMSVVALSRSRLHYTRRATIVEGRMNTTGISAEPGATVRLYNVTMAAGALDGSFELDGATIETTRIGVTASTELIAFGSAVSSNTFCENAALFAVGSFSVVQCNECGDWFQAEQACLLPNQESLGENFCPALSMSTDVAMDMDMDMDMDTDMAETPTRHCEPGLASRTRPTTYIHDR